MVIRTIKFQKASSCTYILTPRLRTCHVVDLKLPNMLTNTTSNIRNTAEEYVHYVIQNAAPKAMSLSTIKEATNLDPVLQFLRECITMAQG